jgi:hypothetical protein
VPTISALAVHLNLLRHAPAGLTLNNYTLCQHFIYVFCIYLRNSDFCPIQHKLLGFYNRDEMMRRIYCVVRTGSLNNAVCASTWKV